jgi:hypothetical protein
MFRQIAPKGIVNKTIVTPGSEQDAELQPAANDSKDITEETSDAASQLLEKNSLGIGEKKGVSGPKSPSTDAQTPQRADQEKENISAEPLERESISQSSTEGQQSPEAPQDNITPQMFSDNSHSFEGKKDMVTASGSGSEELIGAEKDAKLIPGAAVVELKDSEAVAQVHAEMSRISVSECPFLMNRE